MVEVKKRRREGRGERGGGRENARDRRGGGRGKGRRKVEG